MASDDPMVDILNNAVDLTGNTVAYSNYIRLSVGVNELTIDLYILGPAHEVDKPPQAQRTHRIVVPWGVAKELDNLLQQALSTWERQTGVTLPFEVLDEDEEAKTETK